MDFVEKLKTLRKEANLTQQEVADKLYVSRSLYAKYESGIATNEIGDDPRSGGMSNGNQKRLLTKYLDKRGIQYKTHSSNHK